MRQLQSEESIERVSACRLLAKLSPFIPSIRDEVDCKTSSPESKHLNNSKELHKRASTAQMTGSSAVTHELLRKTKSVSPTNSDSAMARLNSLTSSPHYNRSVSAKQFNVSGHNSCNNSDLPKVTEVISFIQQNDPSSEVRETARNVLLRLGAEGKAALHNVQLSSHGFQGVEVKEKTKL